MLRTQFPCEERTYKIFTSHAPSFGDVATWLTSNSSKAKKTTTPALNVHFQMTMRFPKPKQLSATIIELEPYPISFAIDWFTFFVDNRVRVRVREGVVHTWDRMFNYQHQSWGYLYHSSEYDELEMRDNKNKPHYHNNWVLAPPTISNEELMPPHYQMPRRPFQGILGRANQIIDVNIFLLASLVFI
jgi:hypothetical protein